MTKRKQKVAYYTNTLNATIEMEREINNGWFVHTCTVTKYEYAEILIVVYEKYE